MLALLYVPLVSAIGMLALSVLLFRASAGREAARAFAFVLTARAGSLAALTAMMVSSSPGGIRAAMAAYGGFCLVTAFGVVHFMGVYPARKTWLPPDRFAPVSLVLAAALVGLALVLRPGLAVPDTSPLGTGPGAVGVWMLGSPRGPLGIAPTFLDLMMAVPALVLARDYLKAPRGKRRSTLLIVSLGFFAPAACSCLVAGALLQLREGTPRPAEPSVFNYLEMAIFAAWFILLVILLALVALHLAKSRPRGGRRDVALFAGIVLVSTTLGGLTATIDELAATLAAIGVMVGFWSMLGAILVGYGVMRYSLFDLDLRLKVTIRRSSVAAVFVAVYFVVSEAGAVWFSDVSGSDYWGIAAAALLLLILHPIQHAAERVVDGLMPRARPLTSLDHAEAREFYREHVDLMWLDGHLSPKDRLVLASLRARLGLDPETAEAIELEVLSAQTTD